MSLARPRPCRAYRLRSDLFVRAADAVVDLIERHATAIGVAAVFAIYLFAGTLDGRDELRAENDRLVEQNAELAAYASGRVVTLTVKGDRETVANLAGQASAAMSNR